MSNSSSTQLIYEVESSFGVTPTGGAAKVLRFMSESLAMNSNFVSSSEIRSDRQVPDVRRSGNSAAGDIGFELSYGTYDDLFQYSLQSAGWSSAQTNTGTYTGNGSGSITGTGVGASLSANQWIRVKDGSTVLGYVKLSTVAADSITYTPTTALASFTGGGDEEVEMGAQVVNGTSQNSIAIEREYTDLTNEFALFLGMVPNTLSIGINTEQLISGSFGFMGAEEVSPSPSSSYDSSPTAANTNPAFSVSDDVTSVWEGAASLDITSFELSFSNALRTRMIVGSAATQSIGSGTVELTGTHQAYFSSPTVMDKFLAATESSWAVTVQDEDGNAYIIDIPAIRYTSGVRVAGGPSTDIIADMGFTAFRHGTEGVTMRIARWAV